MPRFYCLFPIEVAHTYPLPDAVVRHIQVRRLQVGDTLELFNGDGHAYAGTLTHLDKKNASVHIDTKLATHNESPLEITLIQAISSGDRMDFTLQKCVELGVKHFLPVISERSVVRLQGDRAQKRVERWQEIVISACEQCGRTTVPTVMPIIPFKELGQHPFERDALKFILSIAKNQGLKAIQPTTTTFYLLAGPEGGLTEAEEDAAFALGFQPITLGPRVLRTETAAMCAVSAMQLLWGDF
ncbi:16S rRNA (uracil(1498)-N(3))-methyltransferase [Neisseriaceae bacterium CLB008]|nr:16S rRNA (uracil(1498)-N(3))-methyltransferase [Neisseriaceae bacterium]